VLRLAEYMSGGVLTRRDSETRRCSGSLTERMEFAPSMKVNATVPYDPDNDNGADLDRDWPSR